MDTRDLEQRICADIALMGMTIEDLNKRSIFIQDIEEDERRYHDFNSRSYYFCRGNAFYSGGYERGKDSIYGTQTDLREFLYDIYSSLAFDIGRAFSWNVSMSDVIDTDRISRVKELELLKRIDEFYYEKSLEENTAIVRENLQLFDDGFGLSLDLSLLERVRVKTNEELTKELRQKIIDDLSLIGYDITQDEGQGLFFEDIDNGTKDGMYLFCRLGKLYKKIYYRGVIEEGTYTYEPKEIGHVFFREIYQAVTLSMALKYAGEVDIKDLSPHRVVRLKQLELLRKIQFDYFDITSNEIKREIRKNPELYNDGLGSNLDLSLLDRLT